MRSTFLLLSALVTFAAVANPKGTPRFEDTVKERAGVNRDLFARQMPLIESRRASWLAMAEAAKPTVGSSAEVVKI